jgi:hypothetical protein
LFGRGSPGFDTVLDCPFFERLRQSFGTRSFVASMQGAVAFELKNALNTKLRPARPQVDVLQEAMRMGLLQAATDRSITAGPDVGDVSPGESRVVHLAEPSRIEPRELLTRQQTPESRSNVTSCSPCWTTAAANQATGNLSAAKPL